MADAVALTSVVSSALLAAGSLVVTYRNGVKQRDHEAAMAFEGRVWEKKSEALFELISTCRRWLDALDGEQGWALAAAQTHNGLNGLVAAVEAFASADCRREFDSLRRLLGDARPPLGLEGDVFLARNAKERAIDRQDFERAVKLRDFERQILADADAAFTIDADEARAVTARVIEEARASVRRSSEG